jgi:hypothetical protein
VQVRLYTTRPMAMCGGGAPACTLATAKPWAIGFTAVTQASTHVADNPASVRLTGPRGERAG